MRFFSFLSFFFFLFFFFSSFFFFFFFFFSSVEIYFTSPQPENNKTIFLFNENLVLIFHLENWDYGLYIKMAILKETSSLYIYLSKTSQIIFDLHPGFSHMEDEKGNKLHLFKKFFKMMFFTIQAIIGPSCYSF